MAQSTTGFVFEGSLLTRHEELGVRVPVNVKLEPLLVLDFPKKGGKRLELGGTSRRGSAIGIGARVRRGALATPLVRPVTVHVSANTVGSLVGFARLSPHAVSCLAVFETCPNIVSEHASRRAAGGWVAGWVRASEY